MTRTRSTNRHSATVRMQLFVDAHALKIAQMGPDFLILDQPIEHPPAAAEILISIDGKEECWQVHLPDGISTTRERTPICEPRR